MPTEYVRSLEQSLRQSEAAEKTRRLLQSRKKKLWKFDFTSGEWKLWHGGGSGAGGVIMRSVAKPTRRPEQVAEPLQRSVRP